MLKKGQEPGTLSDSDLHGGEVPDVVKVEHHLHVAAGEAAVGPAHVVVAGPHAVDGAVEEVVQAPGTVRQEPKALSESGEGVGGRGGSNGEVGKR